MIKLRPLDAKDAPFMLEWMHDPICQKGFQKDMLGITLEQAEEFCDSSSKNNQIVDGKSLHFAIADETDEYLGTISLKDISLKNRHAEYAIALRPSKQGQGYASIATMLLLEKAFNEYGLNRVFLSVLANNDRAINLYEKIGFSYEGRFAEHLLIDNEYVDWCWYGMTKSQFNKL